MSIKSHEDKHKENSSLGAAHCNHLEGHGTESVMPPAPFFSQNARRSVVRQPGNANNSAKSGNSGANGTVNKRARDARYNWGYGYDFSIGEHQALIVIKVKVNSDPTKVTPAQKQKAQSDTINAVNKYYDGKLKLKDTATGKSKPVNVNVSIVDKNEHLTVNLLPGSGRDNLTTWHVNSKTTTRAHEIGHQLGFKDEYIDTTATTRATAASPGVFTDNSLMGNYHTEGEASAGLKQRHGDVLASDISSQSGKKYKMEMQ